MEKATFKKAVPVWAFGRENEMNLWLSFRAILGESSRVTLRLTGSCAYNVKVDGKFVAFGPARCAHGFYRVDDIDLSPFATKDSVVTIDVAGYNADSFYHLDQPSFLCAEIEEDGAITSFTGGNGFLARVITEHEQKAERYCGQRTFCEVYNITHLKEKWETEAFEPTAREFALVLLSETESKQFIPRGCGYNTYPVIPAEKITAKLSLNTEISDTTDFRYPNFVVPRGSDGGPSKKKFAFAEAETDAFIDGCKLKVDIIDKTDEFPADQYIEAGKGIAYKMPYNTTGKIEFVAECHEDTEIIVKFDEFAQENGLVNFRRMYMINALVFRMEKGRYTVSTFEPYTAGALEFYVTKGKANISGVSMRYFGDDETSIKYIGGDADMQKIFDAAVQSYRQNAFTIFMDCPSRERAGWLCDSFFTARAEKVLMGRSTVERTFLQNFFLPEKFNHLPEGMFPMCYPAEHFNGGYIPNWAMWLVIELEEYLERTGDTEFIKEAKPRIYKLLDFFKGYENADGLLEKLERWVFVEWSKANELTQDINYPTNMLYARMLEAVARIYGDKATGEKAQKIHKAVNAQAIMPDGFYCDNAVYGEDGKAHLSGECTEACQYYAFFCGTATREKNPVLWERLLSDFGPERVEKGNWPQLAEDAKWKHIYPANAFIGNYLRLELLYVFGEHEKLLENIRGYFLKMAELTGTLWENDSPTASCNHGFASHVVYWLNGLGLLS